MEALNLFTTFALAKTGEEFTLVGATGMGQVTTFVMLGDAAWAGTYEAPSRRAGGPPPTVEEIFQTTSAEAFKALKAGTGADTSELTDGHKGGTFWCHPALWTLMPNRLMCAHDVATHIIQHCPYATDNVEGMEVSNITPEQSKLGRLLQWLSRVANEHIKGGTTELPDDEEVERTCGYILNKLRSPGPPSTTTNTATNTTGATEAIFRDAMSSMTRIQEKLLESKR
jgi:hypothetical protein